MAILPMDNIALLEQQGLLSPNSTRDAALQGLFALGEQIANRSAPRLTPTPPPLNLSTVNKAYQDSLSSNLRMGLTAKKLKEQQALKDLFAMKTPAEEMVRTNAAKRARSMAERSFDKLSMQEGVDMDATSDDFETTIQQKEVEFYPMMEKQARQQLMMPDILSGLSNDEQRIMMALGQQSPEAALKLLPSLMKAKNPEFDFKVVDDNLIRINERTGEIENAFTSPSGTFDKATAAMRNFKYRETLPDDKKSVFDEMVGAGVTFKDTGDAILAFSPDGQVVQKILKRVSPDQTPALKREQEKSKVVGRAEGKLAAIKIPGTSENLSEKQRMSALTSKINSINSDRNNMIEFIDRALKYEKDAFVPLTGVSSLASGFPGLPQYQFAEFMRPIQAFIGFDRLQRMREESPTGGALGQVAVQELRDLQATQGSLALGQNRDEIIKTLKNIRKTLINSNEKRLQEVNRVKFEKLKSITPEIRKEAVGAISKGVPRYKIRARLASEGYDLSGVKF